MLTGAWQNYSKRSHITQLTVLLNNSSNTGAMVEMGQNTLTCIEVNITATCSKNSLTYYGSNNFMRL